MVRSENGRNETVSRTITYGFVLHSLLSEQTIPPTICPLSAYHPGDQLRRNHLKAKQLPKRIAETFISDVLLAGPMEPGDRLPTVRDLQRKFEVSTSTVAAALVLLEKQGIIYRKHGSGCFVKQLPEQQAEKTKTCKQIGLIYPDSAAESVLDDVLTGIRDNCKQHGITLTTATVATYEQEELQAKTMAQYGVDALIIYPLPRTIKQYRKDYLAEPFTNLPVVLTDLAYPKQQRSNVTFDNYQLGFDITMRLLEEGHTRIAFKKMKSQNREIFYRSNNDRYEGYLDALQTKGIEPLPELCWSEDFHSDSGDTLAAEFIKTFRDKPETERTTAVICLEDIHAAFLIRCAKEAGVAVPDELRVVGFDHIPTASEIAGMPFPTTAPDFHRMGTLAVTIAIRETRAPAAQPLNYVLPVELKWD